MLSTVLSSATPMNVKTLCGMVALLRDSLDECRNDRDFRVFSAFLRRRVETSILSGPRRAEIMPPLGEPFNALHGRFGTGRRWRIRRERAGVARMCQPG